MPYIKHIHRSKCDIAVQHVVDTCDDFSWDVGIVNYILTRIIYSWFIRCNNYATICSIMGTLRCVGEEFYRRIAAPYEDEKKHENGDVYRLI